MVSKHIKTLREFKKISQGYLAHELDLDQSQYSRRESGEIEFSATEVAKLSKLLETTIATLYGEETNVFKNVYQRGGNFEQYVSIPEKLIEQYEIRIKEKDELIDYLKLQLSMKS